MWSVENTRCPVSAALIAVSATSPSLTGLNGIWRPVGSDDVQGRILANLILQNIETGDLNLAKQNKEFVIYIGSHGDKGAESADIILPSPAYTEQDGFYTNLEGKMQKAFKASYPTGNSKEEWIIINEISQSL